ncbi:MAG: hypothetical protein KAT75_11040 [Dehalococcoidia bacterium]|nr:hypothetical protein [Dehalococcoidia bacterium]
MAQSSEQNLRPADSNDLTMSVMYTAGIRGYDGNPSELFPSRSADIAAEVLRFAGPEQLVGRAKKLQKEGKTQLALHVVDFAIRGTGDSERRREALRLKAGLLDARAHEVHNFIARNIMRTSAGILREESS